MHYFSANCVQIQIFRYFFCTYSTCISEYFIQYLRLPLKCFFNFLLDLKLNFIFSHDYYEKSRVIEIFKLLLMKTESDDGKHLPGNAIGCGGKIE